MNSKLDMALCVLGTLAVLPLAVLLVCYIVVDYALWCRRRGPYKQQRDPVYW